LAFFEICNDKNLHTNISDKLKQRLESMKRLLYFLIFFFPFISNGQEYKVGECILDSSTNKQYCICSDSTTFDKTAGDSYRLFIIRDKNLNDSVCERIYLKINRSPDFGYRLNPDYCNKFGLIVIEGCDSFYLYSLREKTISKKIWPNYSGCEFSDGQGSYISNLVITDDGKILQLKVNECGLHKFNIADIANIKEI